MIPLRPTLLKVPLSLNNLGTKCDVMCDLGRAMTGANLRANCGYFERKKILFGVLQHFWGFEMFSMEIQLRETREKNFVSYAL